MILICIPHLAVTSFYLSRNGHFPISLVDSKLSADGFLCQSVKAWVSSSVVSSGLWQRVRCCCCVFSFAAWCLVFLLTALIHSFLLSSFGTFQKKNASFILSRHPALSLWIFPLNPEWLQPFPIKAIVCFSSFFFFFYYIPFFLSLLT